MMKTVILSILFMMSAEAFCEDTCDVRPGSSMGIRVMEFVSGNTIHSKIPLKETTADSLKEEMVNLQDMGVCAEKIIAQKCTLKFESVKQNKFVVLYRGLSKWNAWTLKAKDRANSFIKNLKRVGFCS